MRKGRFRFLAWFLSGAVLLQSGCAPVVEKIQETTGSKLDKVDKLVIDDEQHEYETEEVLTKEENVTKSPAPHLKLDKILADHGQGEYTGVRYNQSKVLKALDQMPKGLADDKAYAYLLGLVGENYQKDVDAFNYLEQTEYEPIVQAWQQRRDFWIKPQKPNPGKTVQTQSQKPEPKKKVNFVILMDASGSMKGKLDGKSKLDWVEQTVNEFAKALPQDSTHFQLRVFGHQGSSREEDKDFSCSRTDKVYASAKWDEAKLKAALDQIHPTGYTPLALAIHSSRQDLVPGKPDAVENQLIVISDGFENCGGDPIHSAELLQQSGSLSGIHVIGLEVGSDTESELRKIAEVTGGEYATVSNSKELRDALFERIKGMSHIMEPWELRAFQTITKTHQYDNQRLSSHVQALSQKVKKEHERLDEANDMIKNKGKIDHETWAEIDTWITQRLRQLDGYVNQRHQEVETKMDHNYTTQVAELEKMWREDGGQEGEILRRASEYMKKAKEKIERDSQLRDASGTTAVPIQE